MSGVELDFGIKQMVVELQPILVEAVAHGAVKSKLAINGIDSKKHPYLHPMALRANFRTYLDSMELPNGWYLAGDTKKMGQTLIVNENYQLRFLKERKRTYPGGIPPAGRNAARRAYYRQYQPKIPGLSDLEGLAGGHTRENLVLAWDYVNVDSVDEISLRLVRPIEPGKFGEAVPIDLVVPLDTMPDQWEFIGGEEELDMFKVDISEEGAEHDAGQGG